MQSLESPFEKICVYAIREVYHTLCFVCHTKHVFLGKVQRRSKKNINKTDTFCIYPPFFLSCSFYSPAISFNVNVTVIQWYAFFRKLKYKVSRKPLKVILSVCINDDIS